MASAVANLHAGGNARFNDEALSWDARPFVHEASREASHAIAARLELLPPSENGLQILEIGCGTGILSFLMATNPRIARIVAVDAAEGMIDVLKTKLEKDPVVRRKIVPLALLLEDPEDAALPAAEDGSGRQKFDVITSHLVLHHIPNLKSVLQTMHGCLKPGGCLLLTDFEDFGPEAKRFHAASKMDGVARHGINVKTMTELLQEVGFENVSVRPQWTMEKTVEKYEGEFGSSHKEFADAAKAQAGEIMQFPFVLCYAVKR